MNEFQSLVGILVGFNVSVFQELIVRENLVSIPSRDFSWFQQILNTPVETLFQVFQSLVGILVGFNESIFR